jgi:hypothetical protein
VARKLRVPKAFAAAAVALMIAPAANAQPVEQFFARRTITISIGYTAGGSYDLYGRMVARHLGKHIPGQPTVVAQNMPGAGSLKAANYIYEVAPKDGTALGVVVESAALEQALANPAALYDAAKFTWVGRVATSNNIFMQWHTSKVQTEDSALESSLAGTGGSIAETVPRLSMRSPAPDLLGAATRVEQRCSRWSGLSSASSSWAAVIWRKKLAAREQDQDHPGRAGTNRRAARRAGAAGWARRPRTSSLPALRQRLRDQTLGHRPPGLSDRRRLCAPRSGHGPGCEFIAGIQRTNVELDPLPGERVQDLIVRAQCPRNRPRARQIGIQAVALADVMPA